MNKITVEFTPCAQLPVGGYKIYYRLSGSGPYILAGTFYISPAAFYDAINLPGVCYEGYIVSDCGNGLLGTPVPFESCGSIIESGGGPAPDVFLVFSAVYDVGSCILAILSDTLPVPITINHVVSSGFSGAGCHGFEIASITLASDRTINAGLTTMSCTADFIGGTPPSVGSYSIHNVIVEGQSVNNGDVINMGGVNVQMVIPSCDIA